MVRRELSGIDYSEFEHPFEKKAFETLKNTPGFENLINKIKPYLKDNILKLDVQGSSFRVSAKLVPELHNALIETTRVLNLNFVPDMYITGDSGINAFTSGIEKPAVIISRGAFEALMGDEIYFILGAQVARIKSKKLFYYEALRVLYELDDIDLSSAITPSLKISINFWQRMFEYSTDRGGFLACQDTTSAYKTLAKISGLPSKLYGSLNIGQYIEQIKELQSINFETVDRTAASICKMWHEQSFASSRVFELNKWIESKGHETLLNKFSNGKSVGTTPKASSFCTQCGYKLTGNEVFCPGCGKKCR